MAAGSERTKGKNGGSEGSKAAESQAASEEGPSPVLSVCGFPLDELPCQLCLRLETSGAAVGEERKRLLCPHRPGQSDLFNPQTFRPHGELLWPKTFSFLSSTGVRSLKGWKERGEGGKDPSEGQEGEPLTLSGKASLAAFPLGLRILTEE